MTRAAAGNGHLVEEKLPGKQGEAETVGKRLNTLLAELNNMGCELKGLEQGLIDFPAERDGHPVYLCWRLGEEQITFWHEMDTGFAFPTSKEVGHPETIDSPVSAYRYSRLSCTCNL